MSGYLRVAALKAASYTSRATSELLRYGTDGNGMPGHPFGTQDPTVELAQALITAAIIEQHKVEAIHGTEWSDESLALNALVAALDQFLADWVPGDSEVSRAADYSVLHSLLPQDCRAIFPNPYRPSVKPREDRR